MSTESPPEIREKPRETPARARSTHQESAQGPTPWRSRLADGCLIALFLSLTFLLGVFRLKDTDFYWHLRTGDLIRQTGRVPRVDLFTFTRQGVPWIDLHWIFQIAISWMYQHGGIPGLNLAKCAITCVAMLLLITARRREWPVSVMVLAWLPALLVLGGRMYVRPETLTLLYLSIFLAILFRWDRSPRLALLLPFVQVAWVNSHGLFVLGPILLVFGLLDAALRFGFFAPERRKWWRTIAAASVLTGAACLINPYILTGALYPLELAGTMSNPIFSRYIAELTPIADFIQSADSRNLPMLLHLITMVLGALSFLIPLVWMVRVGPADDQRAPADRPESPQPGRERASGGKVRARSKTPRPEPVKRKQASPAAGDKAAGWRLSPFRLLLYAAFSVLSLQATRNSHQFAAVVGTITAWNFGEWAAVARRRRAGVEQAGTTKAAMASPRLIAFCAVVLGLLWVGSGVFYQMTGEGRVVSLGEEPVFFAHQAARFAGEPGMPDRFLSFHNGHSSLFEYYHGPQRKVYTDPRLEVAGADLFARYIELSHRIGKNMPGWEAVLNEMGRPVIMVDHEHNWEIGATLLRSDHWRCVWFDAIVAVFVHDSNSSIVAAHGVDFGARHFGPGASRESPEIIELIALAKAFRSYAPAVGPPGAELNRQLTWLGLDDARLILRGAPDSSVGWKLLGQIELVREFDPGRIGPRYRAPFDPVLDLSMIRATYALSHAAELAPGDFSTLLSLRMAYEARLMYEAALPIMDQLAALHTINPSQAREQAQSALRRAEHLRKLGSPAVTTSQDLRDLDQKATAHLAAGRAESAVRMLEQAYPPEKAPWEVCDKIATLWLHLGEPARARDVWQKATSVPQPAVRDARIGTTHLVEADFNAARRSYQRAIESDPALFEALYCLAVLEQDAGNPGPAYEYANRAIKVAPDDVSRSAVRAVATGVDRYARPSTTEGRESLIDLH